MHKCVKIQQPTSLNKLINQNECKFKITNIDSTMFANIREHTKANPEPQKIKLL